MVISYMIYDQSHPLSLLVLYLLFITEGQGLVVQTTVGADAVLPCVVDPTPHPTIDLADLIIKWFRPGHQDNVYYQKYGGDDIEDYEGRTSLFKDEVKKGNVSIKLSRVQPSDEGNYTCRIRNKKVPTDAKLSTVQLTVATVFSVSMKLEGDDTLTCSSRGIYPEPTLTWSTSPPTIHTFYNSTRVTKTTEGLYDVSSSLTFTAKDSQLGYICSVGTERGGKAATLRQLTPVHGYDSDEVEIPCEAPSSALKDFSITWSFNHSEIILSYSSTSRLLLVQDQWKERVKGVSESGALQLSASSGKLKGVYKCELCYADDTYVAYTTLKMEQKPGGYVRALGSGIVAAVLFGIAAAAAAAAAAAVFWFRKQRKPKQTLTAEDKTPAEKQTLQTQSGII